MSGPILSQQFVDFVDSGLSGFLEFVSQKEKGGVDLISLWESIRGKSPTLTTIMIGTASSSAVASAAVSGGCGGGGLDDINLYDISAEDMLDIWGDHHMDTAAAEVGKQADDIALHYIAASIEIEMATRHF